MQIRFIEKKFRSTSKEDVDPFYFKKKKLDLHLMKMQIHFILRKKKFRSTSKEDADSFLFEENSDLHLMKIQIRFYADFETKKEIITIIKRIKNMFQQNKLTTHVMNI